MHSLAFPFPSSDRFETLSGCRSSRPFCMNTSHILLEAWRQMLAVWRRQNGVRWGKRSLMSQARQGRGGGRV